MGKNSYNANVKELHDTPGSEYFAFLSRKAHEGALNQAKIDVAEARMRGEIGEKEKQGLTAQHISKIEADTAIKETERKKDKATAEASFSVRQQELNMEVQQATIKAKRAAEARDAELSKDVEKKRAEMELERLRAVDVVKSVIARETQEQKADAAAYTTKKVMLQKPGLSDLILTFFIDRRCIRIQRSKNCPCLPIRPATPSGR